MGGLGRYPDPADLRGGGPGITDNGVGLSDDMSLAVSL
jgi:hypothetical protein